MVSAAEEGMDATTVFVIVIVVVFLGAMIGFQVYIHTGKGNRPEDESKDKRQRP